MRSGSPARSRTGNGIGGGRLDIHKQVTAEPQDDQAEHPTRQQVNDLEKELTCLKEWEAEKLRYERFVNPVSIADGPVGEVGGFLDHYPFSKGVSHWLERHNAYSSLEARQIVENRRVFAKPSVYKALMAGGYHERRLHQKELFYRLPFRPLVKFCILYFGKRGLLDGRAGFQYAVLQAFYEYMIVLKVRESQGMS